MKFGKKEKVENASTQEEQANEMEKRKSK